MRPAETPKPETPDQLADRLKERVYVTFTALAVLIALTSHGAPPSAGSAALSLVLTTLGVLLAGFAADVIAHSTIHSALPTGPALRHMTQSRQRRVRCHRRAAGPAAARGPRRHLDARVR